MRHAPIDPSLFISNRRRLAALLPAKSLAVVHAADVLPATGDGTMPFHPAADLFYLTGVEQEESVLVLCPDAVVPEHREMLFIRQTDGHLATWEGEKLSPESARGVSGIARVRWLSELEAALHGLMGESEAVYLNANEHERARVDVEPRDVRMARGLMARHPLHDYRRLAPLLRRLRARKSPAEVDLIRRAVDTTAAGLRRLLAAVRPGAMEYELEAELLAEFTRGRAKMAYEPIIAAGGNACVLHYCRNDQECRDGQLVLVDAGACYANYNADLTRTYPVSGRFSPRQRAVYDAVLRVLRHSIARTTVGTTIRDWRRAAQVEMAAELAQLGLLTTEQAARDTAEEPACRPYFMHGIGHSLGLGVHDLAPQNGPFEAGWVVTVEPGIYIPEEGIGVRLENDVLVTESGPVDLCQNVPIEADEIERLMARGPAA